ncbi:hypothetical protein M422DRAFT_255244 [Sphaerobolus stellatus SS14]|uniref:SWIM-type domain-containing protein n=1 Tax=Sphaerobolus stellatus (strain SS14) TaxID=990650 RepID=A0A0C9VTX8_SPHS4|nr:hypothetical protein M422DRAFT_255244 [Sphaerobolus stellatus SS14]
MSARHSATQVPWRSSLNLTEEQLGVLNSMYAASSSDQIEDDLYSAVNKLQQEEAISLLTTYGLNEASLEDVSCLWSVKWTKSNGIGEQEERRTLYQCDCGREHTQFGTKKRQTAYNYTGCLAHAEISTDARKQCSHECHPFLCIHRSIQLRYVNSTKAHLLQLYNAKNRDLFRTQGYPDQPSHAKLHTSQYRWIMKSQDTRALYRQYNRMIGVNTKKKPHININEWLDPASPHYNLTLAEAVFHYSPRAALNQRFEVCISTKEMKQMGWKHGHKSQIMLDGTFGICDSKLLLFILMAVDEKGKGVPLAFLLFSAPSGNKQTSSGYDTEILTKLLRQWRTDLESFKGKSFEVLVAITDTDLKELGALLAVFPHILLLICKFHIRQSWRNHRNKVLKGQSPALMHLKSWLKRLEDDLIQTTEFVKVKALLYKEREILTAMKEDSETTSLGERGLLHVEYLDGYWCNDSLWQSWSDFGHRLVSHHLKCSFDGFLPTTNHLESFNGLLKHKHLQRWQRGGCRLRVDMLLQLLVLKVLPSIFEQRHLEAMEDQRWAARIQTIPGGQQIIKAKAAADLMLPPIAYLVVDQQRDQAATALVQQQKISISTFYPEGLYFNSYSSLLTVHDKNPRVYQVRLGYKGMASCTCADFMNRGGACKHIRAALLQINLLRQAGHPIPLISLPCSESEARIHQLAAMDSTGPVPVPDDAPISKAAATVIDLLTEVPEVYAEPGFDEFASESRDSADDGVDDDTESAATDTEDEFDFTILKSSKEAVDAQSLAWFTHEAKTAGPKIGDLATILPDHEISMSTEQINDLIGFRENLALLLKIDRMLPSNGASKKPHVEAALREKKNISPSIPLTQRSHTVHHESGQTL